MNGWFARHAMQLAERIAHIGLLFFAAVALAGCAQQPAYEIYSHPAPRVGTVESVRQVDRQKYVSGAGAIGGALLGAGLGSLIGGGSGNTAAVIAPTVSDTITAAVRPALPSPNRKRPRGVSPSAVSPRIEGALTAWVLPRPSPGYAGTRPHPEGPR